MDSDHPSLVKQVSRRIVVEALLHRAPISRADLARVTGLSKQTMTQVIGGLEEAGLVKLAGTRRGAIGRTAATYEIARQAAYSIGADLGGTKLTVAIADLLGRIVAEGTEPTDVRGGFEVLRQIQALAANLAASHRIDLGHVESVVVGMPGVVDPKSGGVSLVPNIKSLSDLNVPGVLGQLFGLDVVVENDVNLAMLGEAWQGNAQGCENAGFLALGTGIGLGLIINGKLARGATGAAGEVAYLPIGHDLASPLARDVGAFELEVGAKGILRRYQERSGASVETVRDIFGLSEAGDANAAAVLDDTAQYVALAITALQAIIDLDRIVLGGSIGVRPELAHRVQVAMPTVFARQVAVLPSALGSRAGLVGAVSSAVHRVHNQRFGISDIPGDLVVSGTILARAAE